MSVEQFLPLLKSVYGWRFHKLFPLLAALVTFVGLLYVGLPNGIEISFAIRTIFSALVAITVGALAYFTYRIPKVKKHHLGVAFAIAAENETLDKRFSADIIRETEKILDEVKEESPFHVIQIPCTAFSEKLDVATANILRAKCRAHLLIFGEIKLRKERGQQYYVLKLNGIVTHAPIAKEPSSLLAKEMTAILPLKKQIQENDEISGFEITSLQLALAIKYVLATAALLSHDGSLAIKLLEQIQNQKKLLQRNGNLEPIRKLSRLLPKRLRDTYRFMSIVAFVRWEATRNEACLVRAVEWLERDNKKVNEDNINYLLLKAVESFVVRKSVSGAKQWILKCQMRAFVNPTWRYSAAFLAAYEGNLDDALNNYESVNLLDSGHETPFQVEGFIAWVLESEPQQCQLNFCLGYINETMKADHVLATRYFREFLEKCKTLPNASKAIAHATGYLQARTHGHQ